MTRRSTQILLVLGTAALIACGGAEGAAPKAASPAPERAPEAEAPEPRSVQEAQEQIDRLSAQLGGSPKAASTPSTQPSEASPPKPAPPPPASDTKADHLSATDSCVSPCRALASMRRAVDALCRMTGETDNRCVDAKKTLAESVGRTSSCKCSS